MSHRVLSLPLALCAAFALACGGASESMNDRIAEEIAERAIEANNPGTTVDLSSGSAVVTTADGGTMKLGGAADASGAPEWLRPPAGANVVTSSSFGGNTMIIYESKAGAKEACAHHEGKTPSDWKRTSTMDLGSDVLLTFQGPKEALVSITCTQGSPTTVSVSAVGG